MIKLNSYYWELYKSSVGGQKTLAEFAAFANGSLSVQEKANLLKDFDPEYFMNSDFDKTLEYLNESLFEIQNYFKSQGILSHEEIRKKIEYIITLDADFVLSNIVPISFILFEADKDDFYPYLFSFRYKYLQHVIDTLDLDLEDTPGPIDKEKRCMYYFRICDALNQYRHSYGLSAVEMCALIYDMERCAYDAEFSQQTTPYPRAWWIVGRKTEEESKGSTMFWQANPEIRKGDILVFYEKGDTFDKSHKSSITGIWTAQTDGDVDPFFHYYRYTFIGDEVPCRPIPFKIIRDSEITSSIKGVSAQFQNYSGKEISKSDYEKILELIKQQDSQFNVSRIPQLYSGEIYINTPFEDRGDMKPEKWVEENRIVPLLKKMGWEKEGIDYRRQVFLQLGRIKSEEKKIQSGRTDFSIFPFGDRKQCADILIEAKGPGEMDGAKLRLAFDQGESYASRQYAELMGLCDDKQLLLYVRSKDGNFKYTNTPFATFEWKSLFEANSEELTRLYSLFLTFQKHKPGKSNN